MKLSKLWFNRNPYLWTHSHQYTTPNLLTFWTLINISWTKDFWFTFFFTTTSTCKNKTRSLELRNQISLNRKGKKRPRPFTTEEHRRNLSLAHKGKSWWTNGTNNKFAFECPPEFYKGITRNKI